MKLVYFDFGEPRILAASVAAMKSSGHEATQLELLPYMVEEHDVITERVDIGVPSHSDIVTYGRLRVRCTSGIIETDLAETKDVLAGVDAIITGRELWVQARRLAKKLGCALVLWKGVVPSVAKTWVFVKYGRRYSKPLTAPAGLLFDAFASRHSTLTVVNDPFTKNILERVGRGHVVFVPPTYCRFDRWSSVTDLPAVPRPYVLALVSAGAPDVGYVELESLKSLVSLAANLPSRLVVVAGTSSSDLARKGIHTLPDNLHVLGQITDDGGLGAVYANASCVMCPILIPGFSNRLLESVFYAKATVATRLVRRFHPGCEEGVRLVNRTEEATIEIESNFDGGAGRVNMETRAARYYGRTYSPEKHVEALTDALEKAIRR